MYEKDGALWLKATEYGDDKDRVVIRDNGVLLILQQILPTTAINSNAALTVLLTCGALTTMATLPA